MSRPGLSGLPSQMGTQTRGRGSAESIVPSAPGGNDGNHEVRPRSVAPPSAAVKVVWSSVAAPRPEPSPVALPYSETSNSRSSISNASDRSRLRPPR